MTAWGQTITVGSGQGLAGDTGVVVPVSLTAGRDIAGIDMTVTFTTASQYSALAVDCSVQTVTPTPFAQCSVAANVVTIRIADSGGNAWVDGLLANITVDVDGAATPMADPLVSLIVGAGDVGGNDLDPLPSDTDGVFTVLAGPQPFFASTPDAATGVLMSGQISTTIQSGVVINNDGGDDGTTLTYTCTAPAGKFTLSGDTTAFAVPKGSVGTVIVACDSSVIGGPFNETMNCTHDGSNASPVNYLLSCSVTAGPEPAYTGVPAGLTMVATEQDDPDPTGSVTITNTGDTGTTLTGTCSLSAGDPQITLGNGAFSVAAGAAGHVVGVTCDASVEGAYAATISCAHNGTNVATPQDYAATCDVGPPGPAVYSSAPAAGSTIEMTTEDVPVGAVVPDQVLTITNAAAEANDRDLGLSNCAFTGSPEITVTDAPAAIAAMASADVTFSCSTAAVGSFTGTYSCDYAETGSEPTGTATYTVNCGVRAAASDIAESPMSGTRLSLVVPGNGTAQTSVAFDEILDEGVDATVDACSFGTADFAVVTTLPLTVTAGGSVNVLVSGTDPGTGDQVFTDTLTCTYTDTDSTPGTASWPITLTVFAQPIPTLSAWGSMLMILTLMGLGGIVIRRKTLS